MLSPHCNLRLNSGREKRLPLSAWIADSNISQGICINSENESRVRSTKVIAWRCSLALHLCDNHFSQSQYEGAFRSWQVRVSKASRESLKKPLGQSQSEEAGRGFTARTQHKSRRGETMHVLTKAQPNHNVDKHMFNPAGVLLQFLASPEEVGDAICLIRS